MIGKMFCMSCQTFKPKEDMKLFNTGKRNSWRCPACIERRSTAKYKREEDNECHEEGIW